jgi:hypothetical protein
MCVHELQMVSTCTPRNSSDPTSGFHFHARASQRNATSRIQLGLGRGDGQRKNKDWLTHFLKKVMVPHILPTGGHSDPAHLVDASRFGGSN